MKNNIPDFTQDEIDWIKSKANFTYREERLFELRNKEKTYEECAEIMFLSQSAVYRIAKKMKAKILKVI
jgi:DNA-directed RNA polymerase specialized sigma subunit|nr:MAG TPA: ECF sigma factor [Caudoviricetes sp.]